MSKKNRPRPTFTAVAATSAIQPTEYRPSDQAEKYNIPEPQYKYKILASRSDYISLQEEVTKHLNEGWKIAGGLSTAVYSDQYSVTTLFTQAVYR